MLTVAAWAGLGITPSLAHADDANPPWAGVWRGTIGPATVQVCLQHVVSDDMFHHKVSDDSGAYYYLRHLRIIGLRTPESDTATQARTAAAPVFTEAPLSDKTAKGPLWRITSISPGHLRGVWSHGARSLPIDLLNVAMADDDPLKPPCGSKAFSLPRFTPVVITTRPAELMGVAYTRVMINPGRQFAESDSETFQLSGTSPEIRRVNAELYKTVPTGPDDAPYFTCSMVALELGLDGNVSSKRRPVVLTASWLVAEYEEGGYCGGAYPYGSVDYTTWDLRSGAKVNLYDWFARSALTQTINDPGATDASVTVTFTPAFRRLIDHAYPRVMSECVEVERDYSDSWIAHLTTKGIAFTPEFPHVEQACTDNAVISFANLTPYLNATGASQVAAFRREVGAVK